jgi:hypothetical protein
VVDGKTYIVITKNSGMSYKDCTKGESSVMAYSDNPIYEPRSYVF